jgi:hypothetical protein
VASPRNAAANAAVRRFATVWTVSVALKVAALVVLLVVVLKLFGGF